MAVFKNESRRSFELIDQVIRKIFIAANVLGEYYWPKTRDLPPVGNTFADQKQVDDFLKGMKEQQAIFSALYEPDTITPLVDEAVSMIELIVDKAKREYTESLFIWLKHWNERINERFED